MLEGTMVAVLIILAVMIAVAARQLAFAFRHFTPPSRQKHEDEQTLPSVTVCIPARNETHALSDCLEAVLASTYPKLEIIVLDDSSVDGTSHLIKSFAHAGVRFVSGSPLPSGWLGKNYALQGLLKEASGSMILYLDVDTRVRPHTIDQLVSYALAENAAMVSVMPRREDGWRTSVLFSPLRYFWDLLFHQRKAPAASGSAWLVRRKALETYGGFTLLPDTVKPEAHLAAYFASRHEYRFLVSTEHLGVSYEKKWRSQLMTSIRLLYPLLGGQWSSTVIVILDLLLFLAPLAILLLGPSSLVLTIASSLVVLALTVLYAVYTKRVWRRGWWVAMFLWPFIIIQEIVLVIASFIQYHRGRVTWKGRPLRSEVQS